MLTSFMIVLWGAVALMIWVAVCNNRTHRQRQSIIDVVYDWTDRNSYDIYKVRKRQFENVHYNQHLWRLLTFRDYRKLYPFLPKDF